MNLTVKYVDKTISLIYTKRIKKGIIVGFKKANHMMT